MVENWRLSRIEDELGKLNFSLNETIKIQARPLEEEEVVTSTKECRNWSECPLSHMGLHPTGQELLASASHSPGGVSVRLRPISHSTDVVNGMSALFPYKPVSTAASFVAGTNNNSVLQKGFVRSTIPETSIVTSSIIDEHVHGVSIKNKPIVHVAYRNPEFNEEQKVIKKIMEKYNSLGDILRRHDTSGLSVGLLVRKPGESERNKLAEGRLGNLANCHVHLPVDQCRTGPDDLIEDHGVYDLCVTSQRSIIPSPLIQSSKICSLSDPTVLNNTVSCHTLPIHDAQSHQIVTKYIQKPIVATKPTPSVNTSTHSNTVSSTSPAQTILTSTTVSCNAVTASPDIPCLAASYSPPGKIPQGLVIQNPQDIRHSLPNHVSTVNPHTYPSRKTTVSLNRNKIAHTIRVTTSPDIPCPAVSFSPGKIPPDLVIRHSLSSRVSQVNTHTDLSRNTTVCLSRNTIANTVIAMKGQGPPTVDRQGPSIVTHQTEQTVPDKRPCKQINMLQRKTVPNPVGAWPDYTESCNKLLHRENMSHASPAAMSPVRTDGSLSLSNERTHKSSSPSLTQLAPPSESKLNKHQPSITGDDLLHVNTIDAQLKSPEITTTQFDYFRQTSNQDMSMYVMNNRNPTFEYFRSIDTLHEGLTSPESFQLRMTTKPKLRLCESLKKAIIDDRPTRDSSGRALNIGQPLKKLTRSGNLTGEKIAKHSRSLSNAWQKSPPSEHERTNIMKRVSLGGDCHVRRPIFGLAYRNVTVGSTSVVQEQGTRTTLMNERELQQVEMFYQSLGSHVFVCRCEADLSFGCGRRHSMASSTVRPSG